MKENKKITLQKELNNAIDTSNIILKWNPDPKGYFTIRPFFSHKKVFIRYYDSKDTLKCTFAGTKTLQIIQSIIERKLISRLGHAAYLGKEIEKAVIALKNKLDYVQDKELQLKNKMET
jgi:tetrahydromethanopterin S-methyltransferase subunit A